MSTITFTTNNKFEITTNGPVSVGIERVDFPTDEGNKKVSRIDFFLNSAITREMIKQKLEIKGEDVPELTFKIEIDNIKVRGGPGNSGGPTLNTASARKSAGAANMEEASSWSSSPEGSGGGNFWKNGTLELRDYSLDNITKETTQKPDGNEPGKLTFTCPQCNKEKATSEGIENNGVKYCSTTCRDNAQQKPPQKKCPQCNKMFAKLPISGNQGKSYCSDSCKQNAEKKEPEKDTPEPEKYDPQKDIDKAEQQRKAEETKNRTELDSLIQKGKGQDSPDDLKTTLNQIEQKKSTKAYQELKSEIDGLKNKLNGKLTLSEVKQRETAKLNALLTENNLKKEDLDTEIQTKLTNISKDSDLSSLTTHSEEVSKAINQKGANKKFELILTKINDIKPDDNSKKQELKTHLEALLKSDDHFIQEYVKTHRSEIENALSQLAVQNKKDTPNKDNKTGLSTKQKIGLGVGIGGGVAVIIGLVIFLRRKKTPHRSL